MAQRPDQQHPQRSQGNSSVAPKGKATGRILVALCILFCGGLIATTMMYVKVNGEALHQTQRANLAETDLVAAEASKTLLEQTVQSQIQRANEETQRANAAVAELGEMKAKLAQLERLTTAGGSGDIGKEQVEHLLAAANKRADTYWKLLTPEKQNELKGGGGLRIEDVSVTNGGKLAHVVMSNSSDKELVNITVRIIFWNRDVIAYIQAEVIPSIPPKTVKKQYDFPIKRDGLNPAWRVDADVETGGSSKVRIVD